MVDVKQSRNEHSVVYLPHVVQTSDSLLWNITETSIRFFYCTFLGIVY